MPGTETVSLKLPSGEEVDAIVPAGLDDAGVKSLVRMKQPDIFGPPAGVAKPALPKELQAPDFLSRVGDRIQQNAYAIPHAIDAGTGAERNDLQSAKAKAEYDAELKQDQAATHKMVFGDATSTLGKVANTALIAPRTAWSMAKGYWQDPATAVGDLVTASPELAEMRVPRNRARAAAVPPPPTSAAEALAPEQQAQYTAALDKANEKFTGKAQDYHAKLSESFDEAKRQQLQADAEGVQQTAANRQARAEWEQKMTASKASQEQAAKIEQRRSEIVQAQPKLAESIRQKAQAIRQAERANLNARWDEMRQRVGTETPIPTQGIEEAIGEAMKEDLRGAPGSVKQFKQLLTELTGEGEYTDAGGGELAPKPGNTSPWQTIRTHSIAIGDALSHGNLPANIYRGLKRVQLATEDALGKAPGAGEDYKALKADERKFRVDFDDLGPIATGEGSPLARLVRAPNAAYATTHILGKASDLLEKALGRWDQTGGLPQSVAQARAMAAEAKSLPKVKVLPEPPPFEEQVASSEIPERKMPERPELEKVKRPIPPPPGTPKPGPVLKHAARIGGKLVGGALGSAVGHPLVGYGVGSEVGSEIAERIAARRRVVPPPPSQ